MIPEYNALNDKHLQVFIRSRSKHLKELEKEKQKKQKEIQIAMNDMKNQHKKWREWIYLQSVDNSGLLGGSTLSESTMRAGGTTPSLPSIHKSSNKKRTQKRSRSVSPTKATKGRSPQKKRIKSQKKRKKESHDQRPEHTTQSDANKSEPPLLEHTTSHKKAPQNDSTNPDDYPQLESKEPNVIRLKELLHTFPNADKSKKLTSLVRKLHMLQIMYPEYQERERVRRRINPHRAHELHIKRQQRKIDRLMSDYRTVIKESEDNKAEIARMIQEAAATPVRVVQNPFENLLQDGTPSPDMYSKKKQYKNKQYEKAIHLYRDTPAQSLLFKRW